MNEQDTSSTIRIPPMNVFHEKSDEPGIEFVQHIPSFTFKETDPLALGNDVHEVHGGNYLAYTQSGLPLAYLFLDPTEEKKDEHIANLRPVAAKYKGKVNFVWADAIKFGDHAKALNLTEIKWPGFVLHDFSKALKYPISQSQELTTEKIDDWVSKYLDGQLQPVLRSEAIPAEQTEAVYTVVGKTFDEVVLDDSKDVFIEFYAPWCGHCKHLKPIWDSLGERYANIKDKLLIAKMDATENDLPSSVDFRVAVFPTLKFKPASSKEFLDFNGDHSLESLTEFIEEHAKNRLGYDPAAEVSGASSTASHDATSELRDAHDEL
ncbi:thioredoxin-domain-containing protein [Fomitiporia mediterranea MF3/22]|uniref:thioredoxin-domain-containing protein n=1 Tax=Fomitiporia mediterranea (strain MF3/22) TaxID=694068 RepID=UPI0004408375|nr:thioredoxin-domain-containing protein [Fomitiporia mediterranea MF3/22]EJD01457.1 thioredoxin-domain-containing protein [Fomitiporia mediterranea MF3/22]